MEWKEIAEFPNYEVSTTGLFRQKVEKVERPGRISNNGYYIARLTGKKQRSVHRLVATTFIPNPENKPQVNHIDGNRLNNKVENLEWCTNSENMKNAAARGALRTPLNQRSKGEANPRAKLTDQKARIALSMKGLFTMQEVGDFFGVSRDTIRTIWSGYGWRHIQEDQL